MCCDFLVEYCELFLIAICNFSLFFITMVRKKTKKKKKKWRKKSQSMKLTLKTSLATFSSRYIVCT